MIGICKSGMMIAGLIACFIHQQALSNEGEQPVETLDAPYIGKGTLNQKPGEGKLKGQTLRVKRTLLMVSDLKRSLSFYENIIGLEVYAVDDVYRFDRDSMGHELFNTKLGTRRRNATFNTSTETRGLALREINTDFEVPQTPRLSALLFEASALTEIYERATKAGANVIEPRLGYVAPSDLEPGLKFMEFAVIDPDGHTLAFFKYFTDEDAAAWEDAKKRFSVEFER